MRLVYVVLCVSLFASALQTSYAQIVDKPLAIGGDVKAPKLIHQVDPDFPRSFFSKRKGGEVLVHLVVDTDGLPQRVLVQETTNPKLNDSAMKAIKQYRFEPATRDGKPVAVELKVAVNFQVIAR